VIVIFLVAIPFTILGNGFGRCEHSGRNGFDRGTLRLSGNHEHEPGTRGRQEGWRA
jgi:hypothetical protein